MVKAILLTNTSDKSKRVHKVSNLNSNQHQQPVLRFVLLLNVAKTIRRQCVGIPERILIFRPPKPPPDHHPSLTPLDGLEDPAAMGEISVLILASLMMMAQQVSGGKAHLYNITSRLYSIKIGHFIHNRCTKEELY